MANTIAILVGETEKAYKLLCGKPATTGWMAKSICRSRPQHLFYVEWDNPDYRHARAQRGVSKRKVYEVIEIDMPSWAMKQNGWMHPIGTPSVLARFKVEVNSLKDVAPITPEEEKDLDEITKPWWDRD